MKKIINTKKMLKSKSLLSYLLSATILLSGCASIETSTEKEKIDVTEIGIETVTETKTIEDKRTETTIEQQETVNLENICDEENNSIEESTQTTEVEEEKIERKLVALTFDDGPSIYTSELIDVLNENDAHATFFVVGNRVLANETHKEAVLKAYVNGNEIANHTYTHANLKKLSDDEISNEIESTFDAIEELGVTPAMIVRPPGGNITEEIVENYPYSFVTWSVDSEDWKSRDVDAIKEEITSTIEENGIILCHDLYPTTVEAMRELLPELSEEYEFVTVSELFERNNVELETNTKYRKLTK